MPYFFASSVDSMISSTVIFLSIASRIFCEPDSTPEAQALAAGEAHLAQQLVAEHVDARVAAPEEAELALADALAELEDALLVRRERVVLDLDHLHGRASDAPSRARRARRARIARGSRGPRSSPRRRRCSATGSRATSSRCACRSSRAATRGVEVLERRPVGAISTRSPSRYAVPGDAGDRLPSLEPIDELEERRVALADAHRVDLRVVGEHLRRERRRVRAADDDVAPSGGVA